MSKPFMCGDDRDSVFVPEGGCDCNYNMKEVEPVGDDLASYNLTLNGNAVGDTIHIPDPTDYWDMDNYYTKTETDEMICDTHPIGSVIITSTNYNPGIYLCGQWELVDKEFESSFNFDVGEELVWDNTNTKADRDATIIRSGRTIQVLAHWISKVAYADTEVNVFDVPASLSGVYFTAPYTQFQIFASDAGGAVGLGHIVFTGDTPTFSIYDVVPKGTNTSVPADMEWVVTSTILIPDFHYMVDSFCDKFYWKRIA